MLSGRCNATESNEAQPSGCGSGRAVTAPEVVGHGHVWREACGGLLCEEADSCGLPDVALSAGQRQGARNQVQERALAGTIWAHNANPLSREEFVPEVAAVEQGA